MGGACMTHGRNEQCMQNLFAMPEVTKSLERPKRKGYCDIERSYRNKI